MEVRRLSDLGMGQSAHIIDFGGPIQILSRLWELGFVAGAAVAVTRKTLFGDFIVRIQDSEFALRLEEASCLVVQS